MKQLFISFLLLMVSHQLLGQNFERIEQDAGSGQLLNTQGVATADYDNDGYKDLFVTNGYPKNITDMDYINFESDETVKAAGGIQNVKYMDLLNKYESTPLQNYMFKNTGDYQFQNKATD